MVVLELLLHGQGPVYRKLGQCSLSLNPSLSDRTITWVNKWKGNNDFSKKKRTDFFPQCEMRGFFFFLLYFMDPVKEEYRTYWKLIQILKEIIIKDLHVTIKTNWLKFNPWLCIQQECLSNSVKGLGSCVIDVLWLDRRREGI